MTSADGSLRDVFRHRGLLNGVGVARHGRQIYGGEKPFYTVRVREVVHYAEVEGQTLCGLKITEAWSILTNCRTGVATCPKCKRKASHDT